MKEILLAMLIVLLTPVYIIINLATELIELAANIGQVIVDEIYYLFIDMVNFWKVLFENQKNGGNKIE